MNKGFISFLRNSFVRMLASLTMPSFLGAFFYLSITIADTLLQSTQGAHSLSDFLILLYLPALTVVGFSQIYLQTIIYCLAMELSGRFLIQKRKTPLIKTYLFIGAFLGLLSGVSLDRGYLYPFTIIGSVVGFIVTFILVKLHLKEKMFSLKNSTV